MWIFWKKRSSLVLPVCRRQSVEKPSVLRIQELRGVMERLARSVVFNRPAPDALPHLPHDEAEANTGHCPEGR